MLQHRGLDLDVQLFAGLFAHAMQAMAAAGASVPLCMLEMMLVLGLSIAYDERRGHKGRAAALRRLEAAAG